MFQVCIWVKIKYFSSGKFVVDCIDSLIYIGGGGGGIMASLSLLHLIRSVYEKQKSPLWCVSAMKHTPCDVFLPWNTHIGTLW